jgi:hypothetical protein
MITNVTNVRLENLVIRGGNANVAPNDSGGGIYISSVSYLVIESSVVISNNSAIDGGGLYLNISDYFTNTGWITNNTTGTIYGGGGVYRIGSYANSYFGNVSGNTPNDIAP